MSEDLRLEVAKLLSRGGSGIPGHHLSHELGGTDEIDITLLKNYQESVAGPMVTSTNINSIRDNANIFEYTLDGTTWNQVKTNTPNAKNLLDYSSYKVGTDWIPAFNQAFADLTAIGGGILNVPAGTYIIKSTILVPSKVHVVGQGKGITVIKLDNGINNKDMVDFNTSQNAGIRDLTIKGNIFDANPNTGYNYGVNIGRTGLNVAINEGNMPNSYFHNIEIRDIVGDGFHCYPNTWVYALTRVDSQYNSGYGFNIESTDNFYDLCTATGNGKYGVRLTGSNNRLSNMKLIFNGRGADHIGSTGTDFTNAGFYGSGRRNTLVNIECQENYGHGFVFDGAVDTDLMGCVSDANGYSMISNSRSATAIGFYFQNCQRMSGSLKATIFKSTVSQVSGIYIDATSANLSFDYENDHAQTETVLSGSAVLMTAVTKKDMYASTQYTSNHQYNDFLESGITLTNTITSYDGANLQLSSTFQVSTTIDTVNHEVLVTTNWGAGAFPRMGSSYRTTVTGRTYLVRMKVKPTVDNYWLGLTALHDVSPYTVIKKIEGYYNSSAYTDITFTFTAGSSSTNFLFFVSDKQGDGTSPNTTQAPFRVKDLAFVDITDTLAQYYLINTIDKAVKDNYFMGSKTFNDTKSSSVSVLEYGADKTGVNDSLAAFNSALTSGKIVYVPDGTYKVTGTIVIPRKATLILSANAVIKPSADFNVIQLKPECHLSGGIIDTKGLTSFTKAGIYATGQDTFQPYEQLTIVRDINILGKEHESDVGVTSTSWTGKGIHFYSGNSSSTAYGNGAYIAYIQVSNINITNFYRGIYLEREQAPINGNPWITSCSFDQVGMMNCMRAIDITTNNAFYNGGHTFTNLQLQANNYCERYIYCDGANNVFKGLFWDIESYFEPRNIPCFELGTTAQENFVEGTQHYSPDKHYIDKNANPMKPNHFQGLVDPVNILPPRVTNQIRNFIGNQDDILAGASKAYTVTKLSSHTIVNGTLDSPFVPNQGSFLGLTGVDENNNCQIEIDLGTNSISELDMIGFVFRGGVEIPKYIKVESVTVSGGAYSQIALITNNTNPFWYFSTWAADTYKLKFTFGSSNDTGVNRKIRIHRIFATSINGVGKAWLNAAEGGTVYGILNMNKNKTTNFVLDSGATGSRPTSPVTGQVFYDTTLGKPIYYSGSAWKDSAGTTV